MESEKRVGIYRRVSSKSQEQDKYSFRRQNDKIRETYNVKWEVDEVISNDKPLKYRKAWIDAIDRCADQNIDGIAVEFFDRISRKISVLFDLLRYAKDKGVNVYDAYAECELCAEIEKGTAGLTVFTDFDLAMKVQNDRVTRGKEYALERGDSLGGPKPLSDKNPKKHKLIMDAVADGRGGAKPLTWAAIAAQLNTEGVKPPRSRRWTMPLLWKYAGRDLKYYNSNKTS